MNVLNLNDDSEFQKYIETLNNKLVLFYFNAPWCAPCKQLAPKLENLSNEYKNELTLIKINIEEYEDLAMDNNVEKVPTILIYKNNTLLHKHQGANFTILEEKIQEFILDI
jgi:thioredoxin 1